jgi:hypothetical protein
MNRSTAGAHQALLDVLATRGVATSAELQLALGKSQPTVSRLLADLSARVLALGQGRGARYALPRPILGLPARQPLHWVHEDGRIEPWGTLSSIVGERVHVRAEDVDMVTQGALPWFLAPLRSEGFLGRLLAQRLAMHGIDGNPERWTIEQVLFAALQTHDAPGAIMVGDAQRTTSGPLLPEAEAPTAYDTIAAEVAATLPAGSSAGGEQAKFLARLARGSPVLVKFSPPRGTPFGERWHDLLHAEHLALGLLRDHGVPVARTRVVETATRSYLESTRFDRIGLNGRRHVVPLHAVHDAFVPDVRRHWGATCEVLAQQRRLPPESAPQVQALLHFGHLIGNSDMHFGNLGLFVEKDDVARGRFTLAPLYDMLPMRWRPDAASGALDLNAFEPSALDLQSAARPLAIEFWQRAEAHAPLSRPFRTLAGVMTRRLQG